jgi:predicted MFS family arabinose efflux permease
MISRYACFKNVDRRRLLFLTHSGLYFIGLFGIIDTLLNFYFLSAGFDSTLIGALQALPRFASFIFAMPFGIVTKHFGVLNTSIWGMAGIGVSCLVLILVGHSPNLAAISMFVRGACYGAVYVALNPLIMSIAAHDNQIQCFAQHNVVTMTAMALGSAIGGFLPSLLSTVLNAGSNEQSMLVYAAGLSIGTLLVFASLIPIGLLKTSQSEAISAVRQHLPSPEQRQASPWKLLMLTSPVLLFGITGGWTFPFFNVFFRSQFEASDQAVGVTLGIGWLSMGLVSMGNSWFERRIGSTRFLSAMLLFGAIAFFALGQAVSFTHAVAFFVVAVALRNNMIPLYMPLLMNRLPPSQRLIASSVTSTLWSLGWFVATAISGLIVAEFGFEMLYKLVATGLLIMSIQIALTFSRSEGWTTP